MGCARLTVQRFLRAPTFPERQPLHRRRSTLLPRFTAYVLERWHAGCRNGAPLLREIKAQGFRGQYSIVSAYVGRMRAAQRRVSSGDAAAHAAMMVEAAKPLTPRGATCLVLRREGPLDAEEKEPLAQLHAQEGEVAEAITLTQAFAVLVRPRPPAPLDAWLERAATSTVQVFARLASRRRDDYAAVQAGVTLPWRTGPVEGQSNRLKRLKRQMFGRANIDLLRLRVLYET